MRLTHVRLLVSDMGASYRLELYHDSEWEHDP